MNEFGFDMPPVPRDAGHGGEGWIPRLKSHSQEIGEIWGNFGISNEWAPLEAVLMHRPGPEINLVTNANKALMLSIPQIDLARQQHDNLVNAYQDAGVAVSYVEPCDLPPPNQMFVADLLFMTPEGAILARPASAARAGEERFVLKKLVALGVPILRSIRGNGVFEGADATWIDHTTVIIGTGLRTNNEGAAQVTTILKEMDVEVISVDLPKAAMHLMGVLRFIDQDLAICWQSRIPRQAVRTLQNHGYAISYIPDEKEAVHGMALNFVTLGPRRILMPVGNQSCQSFYESMNVECVLVDVSEIHKAAGSIGCLTGILKRKS